MVGQTRDGKMAGRKRAADGEGLSRNTSEYQDDEEKKRGRTFRQFSPKDANRFVLYLAKETGPHARRHFRGWVLE